MDTLPRSSERSSHLQLLSLIVRELGFDGAVDIAVDVVAPIRSVTRAASRTDRTSGFTRARRSVIAFDSVRS